MAEDLNKFKVVDLKARLSERGLKTTGLKAELVERLSQAISADAPPSATEPNGNGAPAVEAQAQAEPDGDGKKRKRDGDDIAAAAEGESPRKRPAPAAAAVDPEPPVAPEPEGRTHDDNAAGDHPGPLPAPPPTSAVDLAPTTIPVPAVIPTDDTPIAPQPEPAHANNAVGDAPGPEPAPAPVAAAAAAAAAEGETPVAPEPESGHADNAPGDVPNPSGPAPPHSPSPSALDPSLPELHSTAHPPTRTLYVTNFVRPFMTPDAEALFAEHGDLVESSEDGEVRFFMDGVKSHAYATFSSLPSAIRAAHAIHGRLWPETVPGARNLSVEFVPSSETRRLVNEETFAWKNGRKRLSLHIHPPSSPESTFRFALEPFVPPSAIAAAAAAGAYAPRGLPLLSAGPTAPRPVIVRDLETLNIPIKAMPPSRAELDRKWKHTKAKPSLYWAEYEPKQ